MLFCRELVSNSLNIQEFVKNFSKKMFANGLGVLSSFRIQVIWPRMSPASYGNIHDAVKNFENFL